MREKLDSGERSIIYAFGLSLIHLSRARIARRNGRIEAGFDIMGKYIEESRKRNGKI